MPESEPHAEIPRGAVGRAAASNVLGTRPGSASHLAGERDAAQPDRLTRRVARSAQGAVGAREGGDAAARQDQCRAHGAALGARGAGLRLRHAGRPEEPRRAVRRPQPVDRLSFHAGAGLGGGLPRLLLPRRPSRRRVAASGAPRRQPGRRLPCAARQDRGLQDPHGLALPLGLVVRQRLQFRLRRVVHAASSSPAAASPTTSPRSTSPAPTTSCRPQRLLQGRGRRACSTPIHPMRADPRS